MSDIFDRLYEDKGKIAELTRVFMKEVYLLTGSNIGRRAEMLRKAEEYIEGRIGRVEKKSMVYETAPWGKSDQRCFLNQVLVCTTSLSAPEVLQNIFEIEQLLGRVRGEKWGPRTIDIDILYYAKEVICLDLLTIPHPELHRRRFTLVPLAEVAPQYIHPLLKKTQYALLQECSDIAEVIPKSV